MPNYLLTVFHLRLTRNFSLGSTKEIYYHCEYLSFNYFDISLQHSKLLNDNTIQLISISCFKDIEDIKVSFDFLEIRMNTVTEDKKTNKHKNLIYHKMLL